ncbi:PhzF family phenazine biosynthesis protein [Hymenobacter busanensis]|uniref:PhzF family phenazine biosynthesis protein n=1 Tax=Hymenobacter busanensis TaxID=2607656 RepID=A0A7L4ZUP4_9BACT|nr:PhzF family phenazine biosynthesis protein [Hymenobacter busanensis]KAA9339340.1 PhzF family phenazine biosynthesis protein [Hymenobacter busanensis]QHJ06898.1 PhzF family phenazine biosynthesis isomerase [Hymenobacter busanensis]
MTLPIYQVDAFTDKLFAGNPAAVCPLTAWLPAEQMQAIAAENNLAETAFFVPRAGTNGEFELRWFTPAVEVALCGHATLATAHVLLRHLGATAETLTFHTQSGPLRVSSQPDGRLTLDFPAQPPQPLSKHPDGLVDGLRATPLRILAGPDLIAVFDTEAEVRALRPDMVHLGKVDYRGIIATAPGSGGVDFVSRFFGPRVGVPEDPVTGSAHTQLVPYWAERLGKIELHARQVSARSGDLWCELRGDRVLMSGYAVTYLRGEIEV